MTYNYYIYLCNFFFKNYNLYKKNVHICKVYIIYQADDLSLKYNISGSPSQSYVVE